VAAPTQPSHDLTRITLSVLGIGLLIGGSLWVLLPFLSALLWATMIVVATWPLMVTLQAQLGGRRGAAVAVMTAVLLLVLIVPLYLAVATILEQSDRLVDLAHELSTRRLPPPPSWVQGIPLLGSRVAERWLALAALEPNELTARLTPYLRTGLAWFAAQAGSFGSMVLNFLLTVLISALLYAKGEAAAGQLRRFFRRLSPERGEVIVTLAEPEVVGDASLVAVTVTVGGEGTVAGAVYIPLVSTTPTVPGAPLTDHVTD